MYNYYSAAYLLATMAGAGFASGLLSSHVYLVNGASIVCSLVTIAGCLVIPRSLGRKVLAVGGTDRLLDSSEDSSPPLSPSGIATIERHSYDLAIGQSDLNAKAEVSSLAVLMIILANITQLSIPHIVLRSWRSSVASLATLFSIPNPTLTVILLILLHKVAVAAVVLLPQYASLRLHWSLALSNYALALKALISALLLLALPTVRARLLEPRMSTARIDLLITECSVAANLVGILGVGFAASPALYVLSLSVFTLGHGLADSLTAYGTMTLGPEQTLGDFYVRSGLVQTIAGLVASPAWSVVFGMVLKGDSLPMGTPFILCAGLFGVAWIATRALQRWHRETS